MGQEQSQEAERENETTDSAKLKSTPRRLSSVKQKAKLEDIIVVKDFPDAPGKNSDETLDKLKKLKITFPLIRNVSGVPAEGLDTLPGINSDPITEMFLRYQYHLTECADAVAFDQNAISKRVKEVELYSATVLKGANERQKQMETCLINMKKFTEIDSLIDRVNKNLEKTVRLMHNVNKMMPTKDQIPSDELNFDKHHHISIN